MKYLKIDEKLKRPLDVSYLNGNYQKAKDEINYKPEINFSEGLKRFLTWTHKNYKGK